MSAAAPTAMSAPTAMTTAPEVRPTLSAAVDNDDLTPAVTVYLRGSGALIEGTPHTGITNVVFCGKSQPSTPYEEFEVPAEFRAQVMTCLDLVGLGGRELRAGHTI